MQKTTFDDFEIIRTLGQGAFSTVYLVTRKKDKKQYALKIIKMDKLSKIEQENSVNEIRILSSIVHPNIISYKESFWNWKNKTLNIIMEYCDDGDLESKINKMKRNKIKFNEKLIWNYVFQIIFGLKALHDKGIIHRDLKSANVFLSKLNNKCKIGDLNTGKVIKNNINKNKGNYQIGTPYYFSPEIWNNGEVSYKSDIWALGCIIYEMCSLKMPFKGKNMMELKDNICKGKFEKINSRYSKELWELIKSLLVIDPEKRPNCDKILESKIIKDKLNNVPELSDLYNKSNNINDEELSLIDTIEYKNLWDLENKIPNKKRYTKTNVINNDLDETINNDSSFSEITNLDLEKNIKKEKQNKSSNNHYFNNYNCDRIKNMKKELIISNEFLKVNSHNKNKSCSFLSNIKEKIEAKIEKLEYKNNKSFSCCFNLNLKHIKKMNQNCKKEYTHIKDISGLINKKDDIKIKGNKKIQKSANNDNSNKNNNLRKSNKTNNNHKITKEKIKLEQKNMFLGNKYINFSSAKKGNINYSYTNFKINRAEKFSKIRYSLNLKAKNHICHNLSIKNKNDKNIINNSIKTNKIKKLETTYNRYKNKVLNKNNLVYKSNKKSFDGNCKNIINDKNLYKSFNLIKNNDTDKKKKKISLKIKLVKIDLNQNENKINLTKSFLPINPFNKVYNNTEIPNINKKEINYKKNSINNISSKMLYQNSFKKNNPKL